MSDIQLTAGVCKRFADAKDAQDELDGTPIHLQVLSIKKIPSNTTPAVDRYRMILSDGENFLQSMLATGMNHTVTDGTVNKHSIISVDKFTSNLVQDRRLMIVLEFHTIADPQDKIGSPVALQEASTRPTPTTAVAAASTSSSTEAPQQPIAKAQPQAQGNKRGPAVFPIEALSPYQNHWTIKARVTFKSEVKTWANQRGEGKLFNVTFMDETGEIRGTAFNAVVDELYDKIQEGKVYYVSKARVNLAKKKYSIIANDYELALERNTEIEECLDATQLPAIKYNFVQISRLEELAKDTICDVVGIIKEAGELGSVTSQKFNKTSSKRELTLVDRSGFSVRLTLWGRQAEQYNAGDQPVIAFKGVKVGDFGGRSLSTFASSTMEINPDIPEAHALRGWYDAGGNSENFKAHSAALSEAPGGAGFSRDKLVSLLDLRESQIGQADTADYFSARATVMHIKSDNIAYPACPNAGCNKKVFDQHEGWRCDKCDKSFARPEYRYIISMAVSDYSNQAWFQGFNDLGVALFKLSADEVMETKSRDEAEFNKIMNGPVGSIFNFTCRAKSDTYNEVTRVRYGVQKAMPLDYTEESKYLIELLSSPWAK